MHLFPVLLVAVLAMAPLGQASHAETAADSPIRQTPETYDDWLAAINAQIKAAHLGLLSTPLDGNDAPGLYISTVTFVVFADGSIDSVEVTSPSGSAVADYLAAEAVRRAAPAPYFAPDMQHRPYTLSIKITTSVKA